jgi:hypothetical protein
VAYDNKLIRICINFDKGSIEMNFKNKKQAGTATLSYDLSKPEQVFAYKCALKGLDACLMLESLKASTQGYTAYKGMSESVLADIIQDLSQWEDVKL